MMINGGRERRLPGLEYFFTLFYPFWMYCAATRAVLNGDFWIYGVWNLSSFFLPLIPFERFSQRILIPRLIASIQRNIRI